MEKPHLGCSGVPFMNSITLFSPIAFSRNSRISAFVISAISRCRSLDGEGVDRSTHLVAEHAIDQLVLLDAAQAVELARHHLGTKVISSAGEILHPHLGARQGVLDPRLELVCARHAHEDSSAARGPLPERQAIAIVSEAWSPSQT